MKYGKYTLGQIEALLNMIGGQKAINAVLAGKKRIVLEDVEWPEKFVASVVYAIPAMDELKRRFPAYVNPAFNDITFKPIKVCENISRETREVEFEYVYLGHDASNNEALAEIDKRSLRPALPEELLAFDAKYPKEMMRFPIAALGSEMNVSDDRCIACLWDDDDGRRLDLGWIDDDWYGLYRFLAVRKAFL